MVSRIPQLAARRRREWRGRVSHEEHIKEPGPRLSPPSPPATIRPPGPGATRATDSDHRLRSRCRVGFGGWRAARSAASKGMRPGTRALRGGPGGFSEPREARRAARRSTKCSAGHSEGPLCGSYPSYPRHRLTHRPSGHTITTPGRIGTLALRVPESQRKGGLLHEAEAARRPRRRQGRDG